MEKVMRVGTVKTCGGRSASIYIEAVYNDERLSIHGVIGPLKYGNALGGCGQIDMEFEHKNPEDNDCKYLIQTKDINFAKGWNTEKWYMFLDIWKNCHLKDVSEYIIGWIWNLPDTDKTPAWV
jgi:hypothetical protein